MRNQNFPSPETPCLFHRHTWGLVLAVLVLFFAVPTHKAKAGSARNLQVAVDHEAIAVDTFETSPPKLTARGLVAGDAIKVAIYWDLNKNGKVDAAEPLGAVYRIVDGVVSKLGGMRNGNVPGDEDQQANGRIETELRGVFLGRITAVEGDALLKVWNEAAPTQIVYKTIRVRFPDLAQRIKGTVVDTKDRPIGGAIVACTPFLHGGGHVVFCFADATGAFSIPISPGSYRLDYWSPSYFHSDTLSNAQVDVTEGSTVFTRGVLQDFVSTRKFSGQIVQTTGEPVPGTLLFLGTSSKKILTGISDETGHFSFNADADQYAFCPDESPYLALSPLGLVANPKRDSLVDLRAVNKLNVTHPLAQKPQSMVYGTFKTDAGAALRGLTIRARDYIGGASFEDLGADVRVRADGSFWMPTYAGTFNLNLEDDLRGFIGCRSIYRQSTRNEVVAVTEGEALNVGAVIAPIGTVTVKGRVTDSAGRPYTLLRYEGSWNVSFRADGSFAFKAYPTDFLSFNLGEDEGFGAFSQEFTLDVPAGTGAGAVINAGNIAADPESPGRPRVRLQASSTTVTPGARLRLSASAAGGGTLVYKWFKNGQRILGQSGETLSLVGDISAYGSAGVYSVEVSNAFGRAESNNVALTTLAPVITSPLSSAGTLGVTFKYTITSTNGANSFTASGLPAGLSLNNLTGVISGVPKAAGKSIVTIGVLNASGKDTKPLTLTFAAAPTRNLQISMDRSSASVDILETSPPKLTATGLAPGDALKVAVYWDLNRNGKIDAGEPLGALYRIVDGIVSKVGGVRNGNVPGDEDLQANGEVQTELRGNLLGRISAVEGDALLKVWNEAVPTQIVYKTLRMRFPDLAQRISGTVVDTKERPIPGAIVSCSPYLHGGGPVVFCFSDASGAFSIPVAPGSYRIDYWSPSHFHSDTVSNTQVDVSAGSTVFTRGVLQDFVSTRRFSGQIVQTTGEPVPGTLVYLAASPNKILTGFSDETGHFSFNADADQYGFCPGGSAYLSLSSLGLVANPGRDSMVDLRSKNVLDVSHPLAQKPESMVYGTFKASTGLALSGMTLRARNYTTGSSFEDQGTDVRVRADGSFWMPTYAGGFTLDLEDDLRGFIGCREIYRQSTGSSSVTLGSGAALNVGQVIAPVGTVTVRGKVTDTLGRPYTLLRYEGSGWNFSFQADGTFAFRLLPAGPLTFSLGDEEGFGAFSKEWNLNVPVGTATGKVINAGTITVDPNGPGRPRVRLEASTLTVKSGVSVFLSASAAGGGTLVYKWFKNGQRIPGQNTATLSLVGDLSASGTAATYFVEVTNAYGRTESNAVLLKR